MAAPLQLQQLQALGLVADWLGEVPAPSPTSTSTAEPHTRPTFGLQPRSRRRSLPTPPQRVVLLRIPKCASSSVAALLAEQEALDVTVSGHNEVFELCAADAGKQAQLWAACRTSTRVDSSSVRSLAASTRVALGAETFDQSLVFAVVRNPWDRAVSAWLYCASWLCSFEEFVEQLASRGPYSDEWTWHQRAHLCPQLPHILGPNGEVLVDWICSFERLEQDVAAVLERARSGGPPPTAAATLPRVNCQEREAYQTYYKDQRTVELVREVYRDDVETFGFVFERQEAVDTA